MEENKKDSKPLGSIKGKVYLKESSNTGNLKITTTSKSSKVNIIKYTLGNN